MVFVDVVVSGFTEDVFSDKNPDVVVSKDGVGSVGIMVIPGLKHLTLIGDDSTKYKFQVVMILKNILKVLQCC